MNSARRVLSVIAILLGLSLLVPVAYIHLTKREVLGFVTKTDRDSGHKYVYLRDEPGMLYNDDSWLALKRDSGTVHGRIPDKSACRFIVYGLRVPLLSMAPNVLKAECEV